MEEKVRITEEKFKDNVRKDKDNGREGGNNWSNRRRNNTANREKAKIIETK